MAKKVLDIPVPTSSKDGFIISSNTPNDPDTIKKGQAINFVETGNSVKVSIEVEKEEPIDIADEKA